ncbi:MAG: nucleoside phosphorylase [Anaerolineae bacterium]
MNYPILEFDATPEAMIEPSRILQPLTHMPEHGVLCFFREVLDTVCKEAEVISQLSSEIGKNLIYVLEMPEGKRLAVVHPGVGAPLSAAFLDEMIALGCKKFVAVGGAGVLDANLALGHAVIPTSAVRDEGTSYHYLPPSREVSASESGIAALVETLQSHQIPYVTGKTWTTDAIYRETPAKIARRRDEGCITVEMEASAFFAVAQFRGVELAQLLYAGDDVSGDIWNTRDWHKQASLREKLFWLAAEAALKM